MILPKKYSSSSKRAEGKFSSEKVNGYHNNQQKWTRAKHKAPIFSYKGLFPLQA